MGPCATFRLAILLCDLPLSVLLARAPPATIVRSIVEDLDAKAIFCVVFELAFVYPTVCMYVFTSAFALLVPPISFIVAPI